MDKETKIVFGVLGFFGILLTWSITVSSITNSKTLDYIEKHCNVVPGAYVKVSTELKPVYSCILNKQERNNEK